MAIQIHGDAAFPGQGIVAETLNLQAPAGLLDRRRAAPDREQPGRLHHRPDDARSTAHSSDLAKGFDVPIIHVNADDLEACRTAVRLAMAFRERFERDVLIDLVGYRRWGHNEGDEPRYTQPQMYERVEEHPPVGDALRPVAGRAGVVTEDEVAEMRKRITGEIQAAPQGGPRGPVRAVPGAAAPAAAPLRRPRRRRAPRCCAR